MSELSKSSGLMMYDLERSLYILRISSSSAEGVKTMTDMAFGVLSLPASDFQPNLSAVVVDHQVFIFAEVACSQFAIDSFSYSSSTSRAFLAANSCKRTARCF
jgi:hypothetical protein